MSFVFEKEHKEAAREIIRKYLVPLVAIVRDGSAEEDMEQGKDFVMNIAINTGDVLCRVRRLKFLSKYGAQLSIRYRACSDRPTEIHKLRAGKGRWYLFGYSDNKGGFAHWWIFDIDKMRQDKLFAEENTWQLKRNLDGSMGMYKNVSDLDKYILISNFYEPQ